jgi:cell division protein FtsL
MLRYLNIIPIIALVGCAVYAYSIKYETMRYSAEIVKAQHAIQRERDGIAMAKAEWAHLSRPTRIQALADRHLDLINITVDQVVKVSDLPERAARVDTIGRKLESLGLAEPTATPRDERGTAGRAVTPSTTPR